MIKFLAENISVNRVKYGAIVALLLLCCCGPAANTGSRIPDPNAVVKGMGVYYFSQASKLDIKQLDETLCEHSKLAAGWIKGTGFSFPPDISIRWFRNRKALDAHRRLLPYWTDFHTRCCAQAAYFDSVTKELLIAATTKNTTDPRRNPMSEALMHVYYQDWGHAGPDWIGWQTDGEALDVRLYQAR